VAALIYWTQHGGLPADLQNLPANDASLRATPAYLSVLLPTGFIGLLLAAALAAEMSTDSGYLLTWATVIYNDLIAPCVKRPLAPKTKLFITRALVLAIGVFLLFYGLWYEMPGNAWDYLAVTGNIYLASVFTLLVASLYWKRATRQGAFAALVLGAIGPITFLIVNKVVPTEKQISPELAGSSSFALAFAGMLVGSLLSRPETADAPQPRTSV
jgi:SSS family solute:Na+ symporter